jgi:hypothetical protein
LPEAPLLHLALPGGRPATLLAGRASTVLSVGDVVVSSWDLCGRPYALVRETGTWRRGLDGGLLRKREATAEGPRVRERLTAEEGEPVVEAARAEAVAALGALGGGGGSAEAARRLRGVVAMDADALRDGRRALPRRERSGRDPAPRPVPRARGARSPRAARGTPARSAASTATSPSGSRARELDAHVAALRAYFGPSLALRRSVFLGDAGALCLAHDRLLPLVERVAAAFPGAPLVSFVDAWTGRRRPVGEWREYASLGLKRVYVGLETGDPELLAWLEKPGSPEDAVELVGSAPRGRGRRGGDRAPRRRGRALRRRPRARTAAVLSAMELRPDDTVYFSEYADDPRARLRPPRGRRPGPAAALAGALRRGPPGDPRRPAPRETGAPPPSHDLRHPRVRVLTPRRVSYSGGLAS